MPSNFCSIADYGRTLHSSPDVFLAGTDAPDEAQNLHFPARQ